MCDIIINFLFRKDTVAVFDPSGDIILTGWSELHGARLCQFLQYPELDELPPRHPIAAAAMLGTFRSYDTSSIEMSVHYFHASNGFPVKLTWLSDVKEDNYSTWPGLTYTNSAKYCPSAKKNVKGHLTQTRQGV